MATFLYGYRPDLGDFRDIVYTPSGTPLKPSVDLRSHFPPCKDQGNIGSCTGFGITGEVVFLHGFQGSELWLYYKERSIEHTTSQDSGAQIRDGIKVLAKLGLPSEELWPYDASKFKKAPSSKANTAAKKNLVSQYNRLLNGNHYRDCLSNGHPFVIGFTVYESFESDEVAKTGIVPMPTKSEQVLGGHCVCVVGYTSDGHYICRNSWGTDWGQNGYFLIPQTYFDNPDLATDAWVIFK